MARPRIPQSWRSIAIVILFLSGAFTVLLLAAPVVAAATYVPGGTLTGTPPPWTPTGSPYVVLGNLTVAGTLTIQAGTTVLFNPGVHLYVRGGLTIAGTSGSRVVLTGNKTSPNIFWSGIQFNSTATGSISWASIGHANEALTVRLTSPAIGNVTIDQANIGVHLFGSSSRISDSRINGTTFGLRAESGGSPVLQNMTITNVSAPNGVAIAIHADGLASFQISRATINRVTGGAGRAPGALGQPGQNGFAAVGVLINATGIVDIDRSSVLNLWGGRGGNGTGSTATSGGSGGAGGAVAGIVVANGGTVSILNTMVKTGTGGHGGNGGSSIAFGGNGGAGGAGGTAAGMEVFAVRTTTSWSLDTVDRMTGGDAGYGGAGSTAARDGNGGVGGDAYGLLFSRAMSADASGNTISNLTGGNGGNSTASGGGGGIGGAGGQSLGLVSLAVDGFATVHSNAIVSVMAGRGGASNARGGPGGNATAVVLLGDGSPYNTTTMSSNVIQTVSGGNGGNGFATRGGDGGPATGVAVYHVTPSLVGNSVLSLAGGSGGAAANGIPAGSGGSAIGIAGSLVAVATSSLDLVQGVTKGARGSTGLAPPPAYGIGYYMSGTSASRSRMTIDNASIVAVDSLDVYVDNYTLATMINTALGANRASVQIAANLTVKFYLAVAVYWPNNVTLYGGSTVVVRDNGKAVWNVMPASGIAQWLFVTNRVYRQSSTPTYNTTVVNVTATGYRFYRDPRTVDMNASHTENFSMVDQVPPTSSASPLPPYENAPSFVVTYTASDGFGIGVQNVTLWYRYNGGAWTKYATQPYSAGGKFTFNTTALGLRDGSYVFATTSVDKAGNAEPTPPSASQASTVLDTTRPGSHVNPLPVYETTLTFNVSWAPDPGVTDIATYTIQYNAGPGWVNWLVNTTATSGAFTAGSQGPIAFRSIARDFAGNLELPPPTNDTWTIVDTIRPSSHTLPLTTYQTSVNFTVSWGPRFDTLDIASYRIQARDNGGVWFDWIPATSLTSATFRGQDGHAYEFRSISTDRAGLVEPPKTGNESWTIVDATPPSSVMTALPAYETTLQFGIAWGPAVGTFDIVSYRVQSSDGNGPWTDVPGFSNTSATSATFTGLDGHPYAFRTMARDRAGNWEAMPSGNKTWTIVDVTKPYVVDSAPRGADTNTTPWIVITFSEPMDRNSVQQAFSITPAMNGAFVWRADSRVVTFIPARPLQAGKTYVVIVDSTAKDLAGNGMLQSATFQFSTAQLGFSLLDFWWVLLLVGAAVAGSMFWILRRRAASESKPGPSTVAAKGREAIIEDVFLLSHKDGILIKHETRRLRPDIDTDILSGMLTAVQAFVKDALRGDDYAELNEMTVGQMHILIGRGKWLVLAARIEGDGTQSWTGQIERCIKDMEDHHWDQIEDWDGDMGLARVLAPYVKKLVQGGYA